MPKQITIDGFKPAYSPDTFVNRQLGITINIMRGEGKYCIRYVNDYINNRTYYDKSYHKKYEHLLPEFEKMIVQALHK